MEFDAPYFVAALAHFGPPPNVQDLVLVVLYCQIKSLIEVVLKIFLEEDRQPSPHARILSLDLCKVRGCIVVQADLISTGFYTAHGIMVPT